MQNGRKIAAIIGDPDKHSKEIYEIATNLNSRGFLTIIPFPSSNGNSLLSTFDRFESEDILAQSVALADLIVIANVDGNLTDQMEYYHNARGKDIVYVVAPESEGEFTNDA